MPRTKKKAASSAPPPPPDEREGRTPYEIVRGYYALVGASQTVTPLKKYLDRAYAALEKNP